MIPLSWEDVNLVEPQVDRFNDIGDERLSLFHWVMDMKPRDELIQVLTRFPLYLIRTGITGVGGARCASLEPCSSVLWETIKRDTMSQNIF